MKKRIGLIGCGTIGRYLFDCISRDAELEVGFVYDQAPEATSDLPETLVLSKLEDFPRTGVALVVEAAHAEVIARFGAMILRHADLLAMSASALADQAVFSAIEETCRRYGRRFFVPHGAIVGLDGVHDGRNQIGQVSISTVKNPASLGRSDTEPTVVYDGPTRGACRAYPRNSNVHAALALAGLGLDRTRSRLLSDPGARTNKHVIEVEGEGFRFSVVVESDPRGKVTGSYTLESAYQTVRRACLGPPPGIVSV